MNKTILTPNTLDTSAGAELITAVKQFIAIGMLFIAILFAAKIFF